MEQHQGWNWSVNQETKWLVPCTESAWLAERWNEEGFQNFLDLGCGLGRHSIYMAKKGFTVTASDLSDFGLDHLSGWAGREGVSVRAVVCDMAGLSFPDSVFDCVLAYNVIYHTDTAGIRRTLSELARVLKPGGELFLTMLSKKSNGFINAGTDQRLDANTIVRDDCEETERGIPHFYLDYQELNGIFTGWEIQGVPLECCEYPEGKRETTSWHWKLLLKNGK